jgi:hypothetical protein
VPDFVEDIMAEVRRRLEPVAESLANDVRDDLRETCSVPVVKQGGRTIRSKPGEPPRRETGGYVASILSASSTAGDRVRAQVFTDAELGRWLNFGTSRMAARPHWTEAANKWAAEATRRFAEAVGGRVA